VKAHRRFDESGFTLIELLMVSVMMVLVVGTLGMTLSVFFRSQDKPNEYLDRTQGPLGISTVLQRDVNSALPFPSGWFTDPLGPDCPAGNTDTNNVISFTWNDQGNTVFAAYRVRSAGAAWELVRYGCEASGQSVGVLIKDLASASSVTASANPIDKEIAFTVDTTAGDSYRISATRLNEPRGFCTGVVAPASPQYMASAAGLVQDVDVVVTLDHPERCPPELNLQKFPLLVAPSNTDVVHTELPSAATAEQLFYTIPRSLMAADGVDWTTGTKTLLVRTDTGLRVGTGQIQVNAATGCWVSVTVGDASISDPVAGTLTTAWQVNAAVLTGEGSCGESDALPLQLRFDRDSDALTPGAVVTMTRAGTAAWSAEVAAGDPVAAPPPELWREGLRPVEVWSFDTGSAPGPTRLATATVLATSSTPCTVHPVVTPNSVTMVGGEPDPGPGRVTTDVHISVPAAPGCGRLRARVIDSPYNSLMAISTNATGDITSYTATVPSTGQYWMTPQSVVDVRPDGALASAGSASVTVIRECTAQVALASGYPAKVAIIGTAERSGALARPSAFTVQLDGCGAAAVSAVTVQGNALTLTGGVYRTGAGSFTVPAPGETVFVVPQVSVSGFGPVTTTGDQLEIAAACQVERPTTPTAKSWVNSSTLRLRRDVVINLQARENVENGCSGVQIVFAPHPQRGLDVIAPISLQPVSYPPWTGTSRLLTLSGAIPSGGSSAPSWVLSADVVFTVIAGANEPLRTGFVDTRDSTPAASSFRD